MLKLSCVTSGPDSVIQYLLYDDNKGVSPSLFLPSGLSVVIAVSFSLLLSLSVSLVKAKTTRKKSQTYTRETAMNEKKFWNARARGTSKQTSKRHKTTEEVKKKT